MNDYIAQIDEQGYCILPGVFQAEQMQRARQLVLEWEARMASSLASNVPYLNQNQSVVYSLHNKDLFFVQLLFGATEAHNILKHYLNDPWYRQIPAEDPNYILRGYIARSSQDSLPLHIDSLMPYQSPVSFSMQFSIILEDQDEENGCTVVIPGSHKSGAYAPQEAWSEAVPVPSRCGDVVVWDSRLWHGALANRSTRTRWAMIASFTRWWIKQSFNFTASLPPQIYDALTDSQRAMLGYCSVPFLNESEGIDMKTGYDALHQQSATARQN